MPMAGSIVVDTNAGESALYEALVRRFDGSTVTRRKLDVGDVMLVADAGTVVVERKTWLDWAKSLTDGRYAEQKARLLSCVAAGCGGARAEEGDASEASGEEAEEAAGAARMPTRAVYIVEGALKGWAGAVGGHMGGLSKMKNARLEAAIVMTGVRDGVPVLRSKDGALP